MVTVPGHLGPQALRSYVMPGVFTVSVPAVIGVPYHLSAPISVVFSLLGLSLSLNRGGVQPKARTEDQLVVCSAGSLSGGGPHASAKGRTRDLSLPRVELGISRYLTLGQRARCDTSVTDHSEKGNREDECTGHIVADMSHTNGMNEAHYTWCDGTPIGDRSTR
jgi:hypothetical protein